MLFNKWQDAGSTVLTDYGDYSNNWTHSGAAITGAIAKRRLLNGTNHVHTTGWQVDKGRTGSMSSLGNVSYILPADYTFGTDSFINWNANLQNIVGAYVQTPIYTDGAGVLYFDAMNEYTYYPPTS